MSKIICFVATLIACLGVYTPNCQADMVSSQELSDQLDFSEFEVVGGRVYVTPDQLAITEDGMYLIVHEDLLPISTLHCDQLGLYVLHDHEWGVCPNGHPIVCQNCDGCDGFLCWYHCYCWTRP